MKTRRFEAESGDPLLAARGAAGLHVAGRPAPRRRPCGVWPATIHPVGIDCRHNHTGCGLPSCRARAGCRSPRGSARLADRALRAGLPPGPVVVVRHDLDLPGVLAVCRVGGPPEGAPLRRRSLRGAPARGHGGTLAHGLACIESASVLGSSFKRWSVTNLSTLAPGHGRAMAHGLACIGRYLGQLQISLSRPRPWRTWPGIPYRYPTGYRAALYFRAGEDSPRPAHTRGRPFGATPPPTELAD